MLARLVNVFRRNKLFIKCPVCSDKKYYIRHKNYDDKLSAVRDNINTVGRKVCEIDYSAKSEENIEGPDLSDIPADDIVKSLLYLDDEMRTDILSYMKDYCPEVYGNVVEKINEMKEAEGESENG